MARKPLSAELYTLIQSAPDFHTQNLSNAGKQGKDPGDTVRDTAEKAYRTFYRPDGNPKNYQRMSREPGRPLARYLEKVGLREERSPFSGRRNPEETEKALAPCNSSMVAFDPVFYDEWE